MAKSFKNKTHKLSGSLLLPGLSFLLALLIMAVLLVLPQDKLLAGKDQAVAPPVELNSQVLLSLNKGESDRYYPYSDQYLLRLSNDLVTYLTLTGREEMSFPIQVNNLYMDQAGSYFLIGDLGGYNFYLFDQEGLQYYGRTDEPIEALSVSPTGASSFILNEATSKGIVRILDDKGKHLLDWRIRDRLYSGYPLNMAFTPDGKFLDVSLINTDGASLGPIYYQIDLEALQLSKAVYLDGDLLYPLLLAKDANTAYLVSSSHVVKVEELKSNILLEFSEIYDAVPGEKGLGILGRQTEGDEKRFYYIPYVEGQTHPIEGNLQAKEIGRDAYLLIKGHGKMALASPEGVYILDENRSEALNFLSLKSPVQKMTFIKEDVLLVIMEDQVRLVRV